MKRVRTQDGKGWSKHPILIAGLVSFSMGLTVSAFANAHSNTVMWFGPTQVDGGTRCADKEAYISNQGGGGNWAGAFEGAWRGANCNNTDSRPAGYLGSRAQVVRASDGTLCGVSGWEYNSYSTIWNSAYADFNQGLACPYGAAYYANAQVRYYRPNLAVYETSTWIDSPNQNLPS